MKSELFNAMMANQRRIGKYDFNNPFYKYYAEDFDKYSEIIFSGKLCLNPNTLLQNCHPTEWCIRDPWDNAKGDAITWKGNLYSFVIVFGRKKNNSLELMDFSIMNSYYPPYDGQISIATVPLTKLVAFDGGTYMDVLNNINIRLGSLNTKMNGDFYNFLTSRYSDKNFPVIVYNMLLVFLKIAYGAELLITASPVLAYGINDVIGQYLEDIKKIIRS